MILENKEKVIETYETPELKVEKKDSSAKTFRGLLLGKIQIAKNINNITLQTIYEDLLNDYDRLNPKQKIHMIDGWKGTSGIDVYNGLENNIIIISHQKDKETGEIKETSKEVKKEDIDAMVKVIEKLPIGQTFSCYYIAELLGYEWKSGVWKNRTDVYFPKYYFPLKFLEAIKVIKYFGRGSVQRLI